MFLGLCLVQTVHLEYQAQSSVAVVCLLLLNVPECRGQLLVGGIYLHSAWCKRHANQADGS